MISSYCVSVSLGANSPISSSAFPSLKTPVKQQCGGGDLGEFPLSPPPRRPSSSTPLATSSLSLRREPPRMEPRIEPRKEMSVSTHSLASPTSTTLPTPPTPYMAYTSQRHPPPPPLDLHPQPGVELPPPLPPRKKRDTGSSSSELSPVKLTPTAVENTAPPLPPRRERNINSVLNRSLGMEPLTTSTLPRNTRIPLHHNAMLTLPRRNSERDYMSAVQPSFVNVNGERGGSVTPELPPKTYKSGVHSRQQSS